MPGERDSEWPEYTGKRDRRLDYFSYTDDGNIRRSVG